MPAKTKNVLHFCASCGATVVCWAVWIVLGTTLVALAYVALARELPVPSFLLRRVETRLASSGLGLQFGHAQFDPTGRLLLEDVQLRARQFDDPLLTCRLLYVHHDWWSLLAGRTEPEEIQVEGASLRLPAMLSPTGTTEAIVQDLAATIHYRDHRWQIDQFVGRVGPLALTLRGEFAPPAASGGRPAVDAGELLNRYLTFGRQVAPVLHRFEAFERPSLAIQLGTHRADLLFTAASARQPWDQPLAIGPLAATTAVSLDRTGTRPLRIHVSAGHLNYRDQVTAENVRAILQAEFSPEARTGRALEVQAVAAEVSAAGETLAGPAVRADLAGWPAIAASAQLAVAGEFIAAEVAVQLKEQSARVHAAGRVAPALISRVLTTHTPRAAPYFVFGDPVSFIADAVLAPGWQFSHLESRVDAQRLDSHGVGVTAARGRIDIVGTSFLAHDAYAEIGENHARGSYWMDFGTTDYRMLLDGQLRPESISGWFRGDWWPAFWARYFAFGRTPPSASVDIQGRWREPYRSYNYVRAQSGPAKIWGGDFEQVSATVFVRPNFAHGWDIQGRRAGGTQHLVGWFKRTAGPASRETARFEFDFAGNPEPAVMGRMLEGRADDTLALFQFNQPPELHAWGAMDGNGANYQFTGTGQGGLRFLQFPLDAVRVAGGVRGADIQLDDIQFSSAGGTGKGRAALTGAPAARHLGFEVFVNDAALGRVIHTFEEFQAARSGRPYVASQDSKFVQKAGNSQLDISLSAQGNPGDLASFKGSGNAALTGAELGEVHLFGLLSQVLSGLSLSFSSLKLDAARASFDVAEGSVIFPDLKVTGPSAVIDAKGSYSFVANALDFNAKFKPYDQPGSLLAAAVSLVINPLTSILELKLSGPLADPKWSVVVTGPSSSPKAPPAPRPVEPAPTAPSK